MIMRALARIFCSKKILFFQKEKVYNKLDFIKINQIHKVKNIMIAIEWHLVGV